jgi:hypothetical protein
VSGSYIYFYFMQKVRQQILIFYIFFKNFDERKSGNYEDYESYEGYERYEKYERCEEYEDYEKYEECEGYRLIHKAKLGL